MPNIPKVLPTSEDRIAEAKRLLEERAEAKRKKAAEDKAYWDEYRRQLALSTPNQGGAKKYRTRARRVFPFIKF